MAESFFGTPHLCPQRPSTASSRFEDACRGGPKDPRQLALEEPACWWGGRRVDAVWALSGGSFLILLPNRRQNSLLSVPSKCLTPAYRIARALSLS